MRQWFQVALLGLLIGAAESVPGVSGGTVAFISGYYERLLRALGQLTPGKLWRMLRSSDRKAWQEADVGFLLVLFSTMGLSLATVVELIRRALSEHPIAIWSLFFGMVLGSALVMLKQVGTPNRIYLICLCSGLMCGHALTLLQPVEIEASAFKYFVAGAVSIFAWLLPGISGSFLLLLLGLYATVLEGVSLLKFSVLLPIALGAVLGLVLFSQFLTVLFQKARPELLSGLVGLMLGSLYRLWPWQRITAYQLRADGSSIPLVQEPVMPHTYEILGGVNPMIMTALLIGLFGFVLVILLNRLTEIEHDFF
ncbi:MAG: DUF368 domain-containing protein [Pseudomonadales bacterium]|nr:DUF368 domain-containing protein [Pseudomonadales bacterium]